MQNQVKEELQDSKQEIVLLDTDPEALNCTVKFNLEADDFVFDVGVRFNWN